MEYKHFESVPKLFRIFGTPILLSPTLLGKIEDYISNCRELLFSN